MLRMTHPQRPSVRRKLVLVAAIGLILGIGAGFAVYAGLARATSRGSVLTSQMPAALPGNGCDSGPRPAIGKFPGDSNGDGIISDSGSERVPALIAAVADNGVSGYVKYTELFCQPAPASPAAAAAAQTTGQSIPVYASNGTTVVGTLTIGGTHDSPPAGTSSAPTG